MYDLKKDFIDAPEMAHSLHRTLATVHTHRKQGKIPAPTAKLNTVYLWDRHEIMLWLAEHGYFNSCNDEYFDIDPFENTEGQ